VDKKKDKEKKEECETNGKKGKTTPFPVRPQRNMITEGLFQCFARTDLTLSPLVSSLLILSQS